MADNIRQELRRVVGELVVSSGQDSNGEIRDDTSLVQSGLIESIALLELAEWISGQVGSPVDLARTEIRREWDTIDEILSYIRRNR